MVGICTGCFVSVHPIPMPITQLLYAMRQKGISIIFTVLRWDGGHTPTKSENSKVIVSLNPQPCDLESTTVTTEPSWLLNVLNSIQFYYKNIEQTLPMLYNGHSLNEMQWLGRLQVAAWENVGQSQPLGKSNILPKQGEGRHHNRLHALHVKIPQLLPCM